MEEKEKSTMRKDKKSRLHTRVAGKALLAILCAVGMASAHAEFPTKNIRFIVPVSPGGGTDTSARLLAKHWEKHTGKHSVVVENLPGAEYNNGIFGLLKAPADGHTVIIFPGTNTNQLFRETPYDLRKWGWVGRVSESVQVGVVSKASGVKTLDDIIKLGTIKAAVTGFTSSQTIGQLLSAKEIGFKPEPITHKGMTPAILSVIRGDAVWTTGPDITTIPYIKNGDLIPIYVASEERLATLPDVPTIIELGHPGVMNYVAFERIVGAHPDTDPAVLESLRANFKQVMDDPAFIAEYSKLGDPPKYASGAAVTKTVVKTLDSIRPHVEYINSFK
jgi:tripartite-type tricarboxylate transporter receptor subunit TctC